MRARFFHLWQIFTQEKFLLIYAVILFGLLLARNPFSSRTLIPNLEPFPDTLHYIVPARSVVTGGPFKIVRENRVVNQSVPPLYSIVLTPFYFISRDPRMFYFANVALSIISLLLFYLISRKITKNKWIIGLGLLLFTTNFFLYWYPQWAMAENLILPLFLFALYLLLSKVNLINAILAVIVTASFYVTKYAYIPLSGVFMLFYLTKLTPYLSVQYEKRKNRKLVIPVVIFIILSLLAFFFFNVNSITNFFSTIIQTFNEIVNNNSAYNTAEFSRTNFLVNLPQYLRGVFGQPTRFMWDYSPIFLKPISLLGALGLFVESIKGKNRFLAVSLILFALAQILFMSAFYTVDMRYIYHVIPTLILGVIFLFNQLYKLLGERKKPLFYLLIMGLFGFYFLNSAIRVKSQIMINLKYAEVPWYYLSIQKMDEFFESRMHTNTDKPILVSPMIPFLFDFYSRGNYELLPLSKDQEFRNSKEAIWGADDYSDLHKLYAKKIREGRDLYVGTYGLGVDSVMHAAFDGLSTNFILKPVYDGCYEQCKIYQLILKPDGKI